MSVDPIPDFIQPRALHELTSDELEKLMTDVRERRLYGAMVHAQAMAAAKEASDQRAREALEKQCGMLEAALDRVDKAVDAMEARINKIRALRLELGLE